MDRKTITPDLMAPPFRLLRASALRSKAAWAQTSDGLHKLNPQHGENSHFLFLLAQHGGDTATFARHLEGRLKNMPELKDFQGLDLQAEVNERLALGTLPKPWGSATTALNLAVAIDLAVTSLTLKVDYAFLPKTIANFFALANALFPNRAPSTTEAAAHAGKTSAAATPFLAPLDAYLARHGLDDDSYAKKLASTTKELEETWRARIANFRTGTHTPYIPGRSMHRPLAKALASDLGVAEKALFPAKYEMQPQDYSSYWDTLAPVLVSLKPAEDPAADMGTKQEPVAAIAEAKAKPVDHTREQLSADELALLQRAMKQWNRTLDTLPNSTRLPARMKLEMRMGHFKTLARGEVVRRPGATEPSLEREAIDILLGDYQRHLDEQQRIARDLAGEAAPALKPIPGGDAEGTLLGKRTEPPKRPPPPSAESSRKTGRRNLVPGGGS